jgi:hypothetical protein
MVIKILFLGVLRQGFIPGAGISHVSPNPGYPGKTR